jgi:hypothetical protein
MPLQADPCDENREKNDEQPADDDNEHRLRDRQPER